MASKGNRDKDVRVVSLVVVGVITIAGISVVIAAAKGSISGGLLLAGAAFLVGTALGFLFGVPKTLQAGGGDAEQAVRHRPNTSLEEISDWLTKILVGIGLAELRQVPDLMESFGGYHARLFGTTAFAANIAAAAGTYFAFCGFMVGYLGTRLFLQKAMRDSDLSLEEYMEEFGADTVENLMWAHLYAPGGYKRAIELGEKHKDKLNDRPLFWVRLAAAYGQQAKEQGPDSESFKAARAKALEASKRAVQLEPESARSWLEEVWDPKDPSENDLEIFRNDPEFERLLRP